MQKHTLESLGVISTGKIIAITYVILSLIILIFISPLFLIIAFTEDFGAIVLVIFFAILILVPLFCGIIGFIFGLLIALMYNLISSLFGGLEYNAS